MNIVSAKKYPLRMDILLFAVFITFMANDQDKKVTIIK